MEELLLELTKHQVEPFELLEWLKSDSVYNLLRYGVKSPSSSGVEDCEDSYYYDLYDLVSKLKNK